MKPIVQGCMALLIASSAVSQTLPPKVDSSARTRAVMSYGALPLSFEPNLGQTSAAAQWVARGPEYALFLSGHDAVLELNSITPVKGITDRPKIENSAVRMSLVGSQPTKGTTGEEPQKGTANYFTGNDPAQWQREVPTFGKVRLHEVYPGIDLVYYGRQGQLEYDFVVAPGADPSKIALNFEGAKAGVAANGDLVLPVDGSEKTVRFDRPTVYQVKDGARQAVAGAFHVAKDGKVSFALGSYDRTRQLVIDPTLIFEGEIATGNQQTIPVGIALDALGEMVITGYTNDLAFPVTTGAYQTNCQVPTSNGEGASRCGASSAPSAFVTKLSADGTTLVYSTYLHGGGGYEQGQSVAVDAAGDTYVLGSTTSNDFPVTANAYQAYCQPYSNGNGGFTSQCDNFYDGGGTEYTVNGPNLFIAKLNPQGTALLYSTFFGGSAGVYPEGIGLDATGNIYFASFVNGAESPSNLYPNNGQTPFPTTTSGYQTLGNNLQTPALSKLSADGQTLLYSSFLGSEGANGHSAYNLAFALGQNGVAFIGGYTGTSDFPTTAGSIKPTCPLDANDSSYCSTAQLFVAAFDTTKSGAASLVYSSYLGGNALQGSNIPEQEVYGLATDASNDLFVTGYTNAPDFPTTTGAFQTTCINCNTAFLSKINPTGSALTWSTYVGGTTSGSTPSYGNAIAFDSKGQVYLYGFSQDGGGDFPQLDPLQPYSSGNKAFVTTFTPDGSTLLFGTRFGPATGGSGASPIANGIAVDATGNMYIAGYTNDNGTFGTTPGTYSTPATAGFNRAFFAKFSPLTPQSTTTLTIAPAAATVGQTITFAVAVAGVGQTTPVPTGTVALMNTAVTPSVTIGTITLDATGAGSFSTSTLPMGSYTIVAMYSGDTNYEYSQSAPQPVSVTTQLTANLLLNPGAEFGTLQYWTAGGPGGPPTVDSGTYDAGINPHTGSYDFLGYSGASDSLSQTVSVLQQGITAQQVDGGSVLAQISFWEQGLNQGSPSDDGFVSLTFLDATGAAISSVNSATVDSHNLTWANGTGAFPMPTGTRSITYTMNFVRNSGSDLDTFIDDNSLTVTVNNYTGLPVTTTTLTSTPAAPAAGQAVTFSVAVAGITQTTPVPTGTVTLMNMAVTPATVLATITLGSSATGGFSTSALTAGNYAVTAVYSGDANYASSTSAVDSFTVTPPVAVATTTTLTATPASGAQGTVFSLTATVVNGSVSPVTGGIVNFFDGTKLLGSVQLVSATGTATYATRSFTIGSHSLTAKFTGTVFASPSSTETAVTINVTGKYATTTALTSSGVQGSYALTATVNAPAAGSPSGSVVFTDSSTSGTLGTIALTGVAQSFVSGSPISVGSSPNQVVPIDLNGDGKLDLVVGNQSGTMVTVLIGNGDGTYTALPSFGTNYDGITGLAVADFNGDGKLDIATANGSTVGIFLGNGDGTFGAEQDFSNSSSSQGVYAADFNGDGKLDLAVTNSNYGITILIGNGDGTFTQPNTPLATGNGPNFQVAVADFNKDGKLDIAVGNYFDNTVSVLLGNGDGTFQAQTVFATGAQPRATFMGDFNGDGNPDIVVTNGGGASVSVLLGNGDGTFLAQQSYAVGSNPARAAVGDINGDGKLDVAVANQNDGTVSILFGNGDGTFQPQQVLTSGSGSEDVAIADANGDGSPDLESADLGSDTLNVFLNQATVTLSLTGVTLPGSGSDSVVATYSGDTAFAGSTSNALTLPSNTTVPTTTTLAVTPAAPAVGQSVTFSVAVAGTTQTPVPTGTVTLTNTAVTPNATLGTITLGTNGAGSFSTSALAAGNYAVTAVYSGDANYASSTSAVDSFTVSGPTAPPPITTATTLVVTAGGSAVTTVPAGSVVTLTATVMAGAASISPAQVAFCDAIALTCTGTHLLATAQVASTGAGAGTATYRFVPGIGSHNYLAMFLGTKTATGSASGAAALLVTGLSPTTTTIAQSGTPGSYTLTATTAGPSLHPSPVATQSVTINLGQSAQNYVLTGTGSSTYQGATYGNYYNTQGACVTSGPITTCDLTGPFTSGTSTFAAGTYDFQTVFSGSVTSAILSQTNSPVGTVEPNGFDYSVFAASTTMTLKLNVTGGGSYAIPVVLNGNYAPNLDDLSFADVSLVCGGTPLGSDPCQQDYVGTVAGATYTSPVTGAVEFEMPTPPAAGPRGPTGSITFEDTSNGNAALGTAALGTPVSGFTLASPAGSPLAVGGGAYGVATGDVNGDGFQDVVVGNSSAGTVSVLLGKGDGTFQTQVTYTVGTQPQRVLIADLNGDGFPDLVVGNTGSNTVSVLLGNGDGTFKQQATYQCGSPAGLGVMDINHDGYPDVVAVDSKDNLLAVLLGNGDGTLQPAVTYSTGTTPDSLGEADFNGDGNIDVAVINEEDGTAGVFLGNGDGTFQPMLTYPAGFGALDLHVGDFNSDGNQDLAFANQGSGTVSVLLGNGDGTFQSRVTYSVGGQPVGLAIADFNGDGFVDITVANADSQTQSVLLNNGDGTFQGPLTFPLGPFQQSVSAADFNGDGLPDMAVTNSVNGSATILLSQLTQTATAMGNVSVGGSADVVHNVEASYPGDANFNASVSQTIPLTGGATALASITTLAVTPAAAAVGQSVTFSVAVAGTTQLTTVPTGTVTLTNTAVTPNAILGTITLGTAGTGTFSTAALAAGTYSVVASYPGDANYLASMSLATPLVVGKDAQTITFAALGNQIYGAAPITLAATSNSGLAVTYGVTGPATITGATLTLTGAGTVTVTASQAGNATYAAATAVSQSFTVAQAVLTATANNASRAYGAANPAFTYAVTGFVNGDAAAVVGGAATLTTAATATSDAGTYPITFATKGLTAVNYSFTYVSGTLTVLGGVVQTITFPAIPNHAAGDPPFAIAATASSGLAVSFAVTSGPATVSGDTVTLTGAGTVTIQATQTGSVDYAAATPVSQSFTVAGGTAPTLTSLAPAGAVAGAAATTITLTGTNFAVTDVAQAGTSPLTTVFVNATTLTVVIPATLLAQAGTLAISVGDTATKQTSGVVNFVVSAAPAIVFTGPPTATSDQQPMVTFQLTQPYTVPIDCVLTLTFAPLTAGGVVDPAVQFSTGGTTINFTVPAGSVTTPPVQFQTGTVAGTVTVTLTILTGDGVNITPAYIVPVVVTLPADVPQISSASVSRGGSAETLTVTMQGFSNTREVKTAIFHFTPVPGSTLTDPDVTVDVTDIFATWFGSDGSTQYGSTFLYTQPFNLTADPKTIQSVTVTLVNGAGSSVAQMTE